MKLWITGAGGMLGTALQQAAEEAGIASLGTGREVDVRDRDAVTAALERVRPDAVIHCAAFTRVDAAESKPDEAMRLNAEAPALLAEATHRRGVRLIHISTNYVFAGDAATAYAPSAPPDATSVYGATKARGEAQVLERHPDAVVVRTSALHAPGHTNFVGTILDRLHAQGRVEVVDDQVVNPTYAPDLAEALLALVPSPPAARVLHLCTPDACSWFALAQAACAGAIARGVLRGDARVGRTTSAAFGAAAPRPHNGALTPSATPRLPSWQEGLRRHLDAYARQQREGKEVSA